MEATITGLFRHAVKGLSADSLEQVHLQNAFDTFPDDRRFALLYEKHFSRLTNPPEWLHKENFLCAFTNPPLMAQFEAHYELLQNKINPTTYGSPFDTLVDGTGEPRRLLSLKNRASGDVLFGPEDLNTETGRKSLEDFFSQQSGEKVKCVTADSTGSQQKYQFGNTSSGWKQRKDTRTLHIINANTVQQVAEKCGISTLNPTRFRPNVVVEGWDPWEEFQWIGQRLQIHTQDGALMTMKILSKTVRCEGVSVDPLDPETVLDVPKLLAKNFPEHGPYLGVYAVIENPGVVSLGDGVSLMPSSED